MANDHLSGLLRGLAVLPIICDRPPENHNVKRSCVELTKVSTNYSNVSFNSSENYKWSKVKIQAVHLHCLDKS